MSPLVELAVFGGEIGESLLRGGLIWYRVKSGG
jgi:hypothetical protein